MIIVAFTAATVLGRPIESAASVSVMLSSVHRTSGFRQKVFGPLYRPRVVGPEFVSCYQKRVIRKMRANGK